MFAELMPLLPNTKGMIIMTVAKVDDLHLRVSFHPAADEPKDKPLISAFAIEGTPAELDQPGINFAPLVEASKTLNQQIAAKAEQVKAEPPPAPTPSNGKPAALTTPVQRSKLGPKSKVPTVSNPTPSPAGPAATTPGAGIAHLPATPVAAQPAVPPQPAAPTLPVGDLRARLAALRQGGAA